jgi:hypothetical protein
LTSPSIVAVNSARPGPSRLSTASKSVLGTVLVLFIALVGITLVALAFAFPVAVPLIEEQHLPVSADDLALAKTFASFWWAFLTVGALTLVAATAAAVKLVQHLDPAPTE